MRMTSVNLWLVLFISATCAGTVSGACSSYGWFGESDCLYMCHCAGSIDCNKSTGKCPGACENGYFGPACQYVSIGFQSGPSWLRDNSEETCNTDLDAQTAQVSLSTAYVLTWVRVVVSDEAYVNQIQLAYRKSGGSGFTDCSTSMTARVDAKTVDIACLTSDRVTDVRVSGSGVGKLCSLYVSGGRNVALKQTAEQSSTHTKWWAENAVDGNKAETRNPDVIAGTCTHTKSTETPGWLRVTFSQPVGITRWRLYNRRNCCGYRLEKFTLEAFNNPGATAPAFHTYKDTRGTEEVYAVVESTVIKDVQSVKITTSNSDNYLTICEIIADGDVNCPYGKFGRSCERDCNCVGETLCFVHSGGCPSGCKPGYTGEDCSSECPATTWGQGCVNTCSSNCLNRHCDHVTGKCDSCIPGYIGTFCDEKCNPRFYGQTCQNRCSESCVDRLCNHVTGKCEQCFPGYAGAFCDTPCTLGKYGPGCAEDCSVHCSGFDKACNHINGTCIAGCDPGYRTRLCNKKCASGTYGQDCLDPCNVNCAGPQNHCHHIDGTCSQGCDDGYRPPLQCSEKCQAGTYGRACNQTCPEKCKNNACHYVTGECQSCEGGYIGRFCEDKCSATTYGPNCQMSCSSNCVDRTCHHVTGQCWGCTSGYLGGLCDEACPGTKYGDRCRQNCSGGCLNQHCHHVNGICGSCIDGMTGDFCSSRVKSSGNDQGAVIGAAVGGAVALLVIAAVIIFYVQRKRNNDKLKGEEPRPTPDVAGAGFEPAISASRPVSANSVAFTETEDETKPNLPPESASVPVEKLKAYLDQHGSGSFLEGQFKSIPMESKCSAAHARRDYNSKKNRYKNIVPYDHSRVLLQANDKEEHEDYINASFVKGYKAGESFIASQAPNDKTQNDFIRMIWEKQVDRIVMLTNLVELNKVKCNRYWPENGTEEFGDISMELLKTQKFAQYTVRHLLVTKTGQRSREVTQFHFTAWPDKSVPDNPWGLVDFHQKVMATPGSGPLLVHCSAGVGRTGTFIALCHLLQEAEDTGKMDFLATLWRLRQDRMSMIQTSEQYIFLHRAALVGHVTAGTTIEVKDIHDRLQALDRKCSSSPVSSSDGYTREFNALTEVCDNVVDTGAVPEEAEDVYQNSKDAVKKQKNRLSNILPHEHYQASLLSDPKHEDTYINAVRVPSLTRDRQDILTQLPLPSTVTDFWRLVTQYNVGLIVAFQTECRDTDESIAQFLPADDKDSYTDDLFKIKRVSQEETTLWHEISITVEKTNEQKMGESAKGHSLGCLLCKTSVLSPESATELASKMKSCRPSGISATLYMCRNGADYCGLACVQSILLDRLEVDQCLAVPLVVGAIKAIRPQVIPTLDQYKSLYDVLKLAHEPGNVYSNIGQVGIHKL